MTTEPNFKIAIKHCRINHLCRFLPKPNFGFRPWIVSRSVEREGGQRGSGLVAP
jgi:hypothetical protein